MSNKYVIQWKSKVNGRAGRGTKLFEREEGEDVVQELNQDYPGIQHELVSVEGENSNPPASQPNVEATLEESEAPAQNPHVTSFDA
jgi:hypothetical protein